MLYYNYGNRKQSVSERQKNHTDNERQETAMEFMITFFIIPAAGALLLATPLERLVNKVKSKSSRKKQSANNLVVISREETKYRKAS